MFLKCLGFVSLSVNANGCYLFKLCVSGCWPCHSVHQTHCHVLFWHMLMGVLTWISVANGQIYSVNDTVCSSLVVRLTVVICLFYPPNNRLTLHHQPLPAGNHSGHYPEAAGLLSVVLRHELMKVNLSGAIDPKTKNFPSPPFPTTHMYQWFHQFSTADFTMRFGSVLSRATWSGGRANDRLAGEDGVKWNEMCENCALLHFGGPYRWQAVVFWNQPKQNMQYFLFCFVFCYLWKSPVTRISWVQMQLPLPTIYALKVAAVSASASFFFLYCYLYSLCLCVLY